MPVYIWRHSLYAVKHYTTTGTNNRTIIRYLMSYAVNFKNTKILLTGGAGFLGYHVYRELLARGMNKKQITIPRSVDYDLRNRSACLEVMRGHDVVIHLAANTGGIGKNRRAPGTLFYDNAVMGIELME